MWVLLKIPLFFRISNGFSCFLKVRVSSGFAINVSLRKFSRWKLSFVALSRFSKFIVSFSSRKVAFFSFFGNFIALSLFANFNVVGTSSNLNDFSCSSIKFTSFLLFFLLSTFSLYFSIS